MVVAEMSWALGQLDGVPRPGHRLPVLRNMYRTVQSMMT